MTGKLDAGDLEVNIPVCQDNIVSVGNLDLTDTNI